MINYILETENKKAIENIGELYKLKSVKDNKYIFVSESLKVKKILNILKDIDSCSASLIVYSNRYRYGRFYKLENSKVIEQKYGNYSKYYSFLKEMNLKSFRHICKRCNEPYDNKCYICNLKDKEKRRKGEYII